MSDYLSLLAARLYGAAPIVQPRLPARFEPPSRPLSLDGLLPGPVEEQVEEPAPTPTSFPVQTAYIQPAHAQPAAYAPLDVPTPLAQDRAPSEVEPAGQPAPRLIPSPESPRHTPLPVTVSADHPVEKTENPLLRPDSRLTEAPAPTTWLASETRRPEAAPVRPAIQVQVTRTPLSQPPPVLPVDRREAADQQPLKNPVTPQVQPASSRLPRLQPAVFPPMPAAPPAGAELRVPERARSEPSTGLPTTIQVTIGRIEVHAAPALAVAGPRKSRSAPLMSLEEYLKQRNGEKR